MSKSRSAVSLETFECFKKYGAGSRLMDITYIPIDEFTEFISQAGDSVLAAVSYDAEPFRVEGVKFPVFQVEAKQLGDTPMIEVWSSSSQVSHGVSDGVSFSENGEFMFGGVSLRETPDDDLETVSSRAYHLIIKLIQAKGYPHLIRIWNYFPSINAEENGVERYKTFCVGRAAGFRNEYKENMQQYFSAASAVGSDGERLTICFTASKEPGHNIENPRQVSAYSYPSKYGTQSPSFSRATYHKSYDEQRLFIAGTASIVGYETMHKGDFEKQLSETLQNIDSLLKHVTKTGCAGFENAFSLSLLKVYLRNEDSVNLAQAALEEFFGPDVKSIFLRGDICRSDLLLEIECIGINGNR